MCGRYRISREPAQIAGEFRIKGPLPNFQPRWNAAPTDKHPVLRLDGEPKERRLEPLRWDLIRIGQRTRRSGTRDDRDGRNEPSFKCPSNFAAAWCPRTASMSGRNSSIRRSSPITLAWRTARSSPLPGSGSDGRTRRPERRCGASASSPARLNEICLSGSISRIARLTALEAWSSDIPLMISMTAPCHFGSRRLAQ
jgi:hypothetical protein